MSLQSMPTSMASLSLHAPGALHSMNGTHTPQCHSAGPTNKEICQQLFIPAQKVKVRTFKYITFQERTLKGDTNFSYNH